MAHDNDNEVRESVAEEGVGMMSEGRSGGKSADSFYDDPPVFKLDLAFPVELYKDPDGLFTVVYGKQVDAALSYGLACEKLGQAILHALTCDGKLD